VQSYPVGEVLFSRTVVAFVACAVFIIPRTGWSVFRTGRSPGSEPDFQQSNQWA
jgi:hypothetical protein